MTDPDDPAPTGPTEPPTEQGDPTSASGAGGVGGAGRGAGGRRGGWGTNGRDGARRHEGDFDTGAGFRGLRRDIEDLRMELRRSLSGTREGLRREFRDTLAETAGYVSELLPRVHQLEQLLARLGADGVADGVPPDSGRAGGDSATVDTESGSGEDAPPVTPATGWDAMDRATAEQAWAALAEFVDTVLFRQYRLSRLQIPDCWPVHPRMVRELAWLRSSYLEAQELEAQDAAGSLPWHIRHIPGFLINTADAVDPRECRPGVHRLTDPEVSRYATQRMTARHEGRPEPVLTSETGPDRPQLHPTHYPTRTTSTSASGQDGAEPKAPTVTVLPELLVGACHPDHWISYYREASTADLATRD